MAYSGTSLVTTAPAPIIAPFLILIPGSIIALVPILYIFADHINTIYLIQFIHGIGSGLAYPTWLGLWSTHLDRKQMSFEWSLYSTLTGVGTATAAMVGATLAQYFGFKITFAFVGVLCLFGCFVLFYLEEKEEKKRKTILLSTEKQVN